MIARSPRGEEEIKLRGQFVRCAPSSPSLERVSPFPRNLIFPIAMVGTTRAPGQEKT